MAGMLKELLAKIEQATGPDRELDEAIADVLDTPPWPVPRSAWLAPAYSGSIDSAVALVEKRLPGWRWEVTTTGFSPGASLVCAPGQHEGAYAKTPALALVAALLRAELSTPEAGNG